MSNLTKEEMKAWIDNATLEQLLRVWRYEPLGCPWFVGEIGEYFSKRMEFLRSQNAGAWVDASKAVGWDG